MREAGWGAERLGLEPGFCGLDLELDLAADGTPANPLVFLDLERWRGAPDEEIGRAAGLVAAALPITAGVLRGPLTPGLAPLIAAATLTLADGPASEPAAAGPASEPAAAGRRGRRRTSFRSATSRGLGRSRRSWERRSGGCGTRSRARPEPRSRAGSWFGRRRSLAPAGDSPPRPRPTRCCWAGRSSRGGSASAGRPGRARGASLRNPCSSPGTERGCRSCSTSPNGETRSAP